MRSIHAAHWASLICCICVGARARAQACSGALGRETLVRCALAASPEVRRARLELNALAGRRIAAGLWLPTNPVVSATVEGDVTRVSTVPSPVVEWQVTLAQEIEIAGQRRARLDVADALAAAQVRRVAVAEQETIAGALRAAFELVAARHALKLTDEVADATAKLADFADERAKESLMAPVDAHLVRAEAIRVASARADLARRLEIARARLAIVVGAQPGAVDLSTDELPVPASDARSLTELTERALSLRGDVAAAEMERKIADHQTALLRRSRVPNPTLSIFTGLNVLGEQVVGGGLSFPLPLPAPAGHTNAGEIAEQRARAEQAAVGIDEIRRRVRLEVAEAMATERARASALQLFQPAVIDQAQSDIRALRDGIDARQLSVRDALLSERTLIELLREYVEARVQYALAWVELRRATGELGAEVRP